MKNKFTPARTCTRFVLLGMITSIFLFYSPPGMAWLERSQTDLFAASAYLLFLIGLQRGHRRYFLWAGIVASLKWSSLPFIAATGAFYILSAPKPEIIKRALNCGLAIGIPFFFLLFFGSNTVDYLRLLRQWELDYGAADLSLHIDLPLFLSKVIIFALPVGLLIVKKSWPGKTKFSEVPFYEIFFLGSCGLVAAGYGTSASEYRLVAMLFLAAVLAQGQSIFSSAGRRFYAAEYLLGLAFLIFTFEFGPRRYEWSGILQIKQPITILILGLVVLFASFTRNMFTQFLTRPKLQA